MLNRLDLRGITTDLAPLLPRPQMGGDEPIEAVRRILDDVESRGDAAVRELTARFDGIDLESSRVDPAEIAAAPGKLDPALHAALVEARDSIESFHRAQMHGDSHHERAGISVRGHLRPVDRAGCYVPGGRAVYPSTVLMTAVPARVAGVPEVVLCVPPDDTGSVPTVTLAAAALAGVDEVHAIGGAQAIAAMAFGTETIRPVDVIAGPGNVYVAVAKREVAGRGLVGIPSSFAGPSEVVVVADTSVPPEFAAIDVILQAEHGPDGLSWLITWSDDVADRVVASIDEQVAAAPRRDEILSTLDEGGYVVLVDGPDQALEVINLIAPEHLELMCVEADDMVDGVRHAGAVFVGANAPASIGDYLAGPSHVLPTFGSARFSGALTVDDFLKHLHVIRVDDDAFARVASHVGALADAEGLDAHAQSVRLRDQPR